MKRRTEALLLHVRGRSATQLPLLIQECNSPGEKRDYLQLKFIRKAKDRFPEFPGQAAQSNPSIKRIQSGLAAFWTW